MAFVHTNPHTRTHTHTHAEDFAKHKIEVIVLETKHKRHAGDTLSIIGMHAFVFIMSKCTSSVHVPMCENVQMSMIAQFRKAASMLVHMCVFVVCVCVCVLVLVCVCVRE